MSVEYEVSDSKRQEVVLSDRVTMNCAVEAAAPPAVVGDGSPRRDEVLTPVLVDASDKPAADSPLWKGHAFTASFNVGASVMRTTGLRFANSRGSEDASAFGLHDATGPAFGLSAAFERTGLYSSLGVTLSALGESHRTLWNFGLMSTVAGALHLGDTTLYLGPNVQIGTYQLSGEESNTLEWSSKPGFSLGVASGVVFHLRDEKTGKLNYVLGAELVAPVAGPSPWFLMASIGLGSGE